MRSKSKPIQAIVSQLSSGYGAQRLPGALRAIEILDVPSRGALKGQRGFLKDVLPKIKYHNNQLSIITEYRKMPQRKKRTGKEASTSDSASAAVTPAERASPTIRLHLHDMPTQELLMEDKSATRISLELTALLQKALGGPIMTEDELKGLAAVQDGEEERIVSEEIASDPTSDPSSASDPISATHDSVPNTSAVPPST